MRAARRALCPTAPSRLIPDRLASFARVHGRKLAGGALLILLSAARFTASGFTYYPQLDDYIQYYKYTSLDTPAAAVIKYGMLAARPLSNAADVFVWANFWGNLFAAVLILSVLYAVSAMLFKSVFAQLFPGQFDGARGNAFTLLYLLLPLNIEGTYWLSASTRVVCGLFWTALAARCLINWLDRSEPRFAALYGIFQLLAMSSYEQALTLSAALTAVIMLMRWRTSRSSTLIGLLTVSNGLFYWTFITHFRDSSALYASAYGAVSPFTAYFWANQLPHVLKQFTAAFAGGGLLTLFKGAVRGAALIVSDGKLAFGLLTLLCAALTFIYVNAKKHAPGEAFDFAGSAASHRLAEPLIVGLILAATPLAPHVLKANPWFSLRGTVCSLPGIALCVQVFVNRCAPPINKRLNHLNSAKYISAAACALFVLTAFCATASEINDYKLTYEQDTAVMSALSGALELGNVTGRVALVNVEPSYLSDQNFSYHEHIHGVTESDWALSGALYAYSGGTLNPSVRFVPLASGAVESVFADGYSEEYSAIYIYADGKFVRADIN
jgi:hypothetical protein